MPVLVEIKYRVPTSTATDYSTDITTRNYSDTYVVNAQYAPSTKTLQGVTDIEYAAFLFDASELPSSVSPNAQHHIEYDGKLYEVDSVLEHNDRFVCRCRCVGLLTGEVLAPLVDTFENAFYNLNLLVGEEIRYLIPTNSDVDYTSGVVTRTYSANYVCRGAVSPTNLTRLPNAPLDTKNCSILMFTGDLPYGTIPSVRHHIEHNGYLFEIKKVRSYGVNYVLKCECIGLAQTYVSVYSTMTIGQTISVTFVSGGGGSPVDNFLIQHTVLGLGF
jgi:CYTH domain-containing protein